jgi:oligoribonuclease NrnB/cAMP/cGMP phosphodiesterase (DHH superfamily)
MDGLSAAWVFERWAKAKHKLDKPGFIDGIPYEYLPCSFEDGVDFSKLKDALVYFLDFSVKGEAMKRLATVAKKIIVIDHHKTAQENLVGMPENVEKYFDMTKCGATLVWEHFFSEYQFVPSFLQYIQDNDLWTHKLEGAKEFAAWLDSENPQTIDDIDRLEKDFNIDKHACLKVGESLLNYKLALVHNVIGYAYETTLAGVKVMKINSPFAKINSELGNALVRLHNLPAWIWHEAKVENGNIIQKNSLRSLDHLEDVAALAKKLGGGGHRNASGFAGKGYE